MRHYHRKPLIPPPHLLVSSSSHSNDASPHTGSSHFSSHRDSHGAPATKSARPIRGAGWTTWMRQAAADFKDVVYWAQRRLDAMDEKEADRSLLSGLKKGIGLNEVVEKVTEKGGWRAGAAFYTSLSHNLTLAHTTSACLSTDSLLLNPHISSTASTSPSPKSSPTTIMAKDATAQPPSQPHPSTLPKPTSDATPLTEPVPIVPAPPLSTYLATSPTTIISALKLIADSIAQQRQLASRALIFHPLSLSLFIGLLGFLTSIMYDGTNASLPLIFTTFAGICMACLVAVRGATAGYINAAEQLNLGFLKPEGGSIGGEADDILVTTYGDLVIGVLILRFPPGSGAASSSAASSTAGGSARKGAKKNQQPAPTSTPKDEDKRSGPKTVLVRAWTVKMRYRGTGVGRALLEEGVKLARERCGDDVKVVFDKEHANSKKLLPGLFMAGFSGREERARKSLAKVVDRESAGERVGREPVPPAVEEGGEK